MRRFAVGLFAVCAAAGVIAYLGARMSDYHQLEGAGVATFFIAILGLNVLTGYTGQISLGHGAFMMIGGYTTAILYSRHHWSVLATIPIAALVTFGVGAAVGLPALRLSGAYLALATFAVALVVPALALKYDKFTGGRQGILLPYRSGHWLYVAGWIVAAIAFVFAWLVLRGRIGRAFRAVRDSDVAAVSSGISLALYKTLAFALSAGLAGAAGSIFVVENNFAQPDQFGLLLSIEILIGAAVAGLGSLWGLFAGALFIQFLRTGTQSVAIPHVPKEALPVIQGLAVIVVMFLLPTGFAGLLRRVAPLTNRIRRAS